MGTVTTSIVIVNYNAGDVLTRCVASAFRQGDNLEVIVVDNHSDDDSIDTLLSTNSGTQSLTIKRNSANLGFAAGCNVGTRLAKGDFILYLNPDTLLEEGALEALIYCLRVNQSAGMVGGLILNQNGSEQAGCRRAIPTPWRALVRATGLSRLKGLHPGLFSGFLLNESKLPDRCIEIEAISGACMLVRREALDQVGLMDEKYFLHCEDLDWCMTFWQKGWKVMFAPDAKLTHFKGGCSSVRPIFVEWHKHKGMMRFYRKFFRHQYPGVLMGLVAVGVWFRFSLVAGWKLLGRMMGA